MTNPQNWTFLGTVPPPFGGVTVFTKRKVAQLRAQGCPVTLVDISKLGTLGKIKHLLQLMVRGRNHGIYVNNLSGFYILGALLNLGGAQLFFHDHNYGLERMTGLRGRLFRTFLARCKMVYFDGAHSRENYLKQGLLDAQKPFTIAPPFIEPDTSEKRDILNGYPITLMQFMKTHSPLVGANAFKAALMPDGTDLYGLDMTLKLLKTLRRTVPNAGVVFAIAVDDDSPYLTAFKQRLAEENLTEHFYLFTGTRELWPLFGEVDVMVRPTATDGYGISIAEALFMGTPAVASDVCTRPEGTTLFKARNQHDFNAKVMHALKLD